MFTPELEFLSTYIERLRVRLAVAIGERMIERGEVDAFDEDDASDDDLEEGAHDADLDVLVVPEGGFPDDDDWEPPPAVPERTDENETLPVFELMDRFGLDETEIDILLFAAAPQLDPTIRSQIATLCDPVPIDWPCPFAWLRTIAIETHDVFWVEQYRFLPDQPLMRSGLLELLPTHELGPDDLMRHELLVPGDVVAMLRGERGEDVRLKGVAERDDGRIPVPVPGVPTWVLDHLRALVTGHMTGRDHVGGWGAIQERADMVVVSGGRGAGKTLAVHWVCQSLAVPVIRVDAPSLAQGMAWDVSVRVEAAVRQAALHREVLLIDAAESAFGRDTPAAAALMRAVRRFRALIFLVVRAPEALEPRLLDAIPVRVVLPVPKLDTIERAWDLALTMFDVEGIDPRKAATRYPLDGRQIMNTARAAALKLTGEAELAALAAELDGEGSEDEPADALAGAEDLALAADLEDDDDDDEVVAIPLTDAEYQRDIRQMALAEAAVTQLDDNLGKLGFADASGATLDDLVLPKTLRLQIQEIISAFNHWHVLYNDWGFGERIHRGRGLICLFDGEPGTGKTLSAEVLANHLGLKLVRINTGQVIDKYIGETEKRLTEIFERAHPGMNLLLFDEADSLFGKRTKVERSTDRYANAAINVLLQLVEHYEGLVCLTTNLKQGIDPAFERRFTYKLRFTVPTPKQRARIWRRLIPAGAPVEDDIDYLYLGRELELSGGGIKTAVIRAGYLALKAGQPLGMEHLMEAGYRELAATGKLVRQDFS